MRLLIVSLSLSFLSCSSLQTKTSCELEQFGVIKFTNNTDEFKQVYVFRVVYAEGEYRRVGDPFQRLIEPLTEGRLRVHPGMVLVIVDRIKGKRWGKVIQIKLCQVVRIKTTAPVVFKKLEIRPRHSIEGGL